MKITFLATLIVGFSLLSSCGSSGSASNRADDLCSCAQEAGIDFNGITSERDLNRLARKMENLPEKEMKKAGKCIVDVLKGIQKDVKEMNDSEKSAYIRSFAKATIDTDCVIDGMEDFKYDEFENLLDLGIDGLEDELERN